MSIVSISDAARLAEVTRQTIYDRINSGTLSRTPDGIDVAELARVYPNLQPLENIRIKRIKKRSEKQGSDEDDQVPAELLESQIKENEWLKEELAKRDEMLAAKESQMQKQADRLFEKDQFWQKHLDEVRGDFQRLLEAPPPKRKKVLGIF